MEEKKIYCFLGLPASGKGTQAEKFAEDRGYIRVGIGDITREAMESNEDPELRKRFRERYEAGKLQPDEEIFPLLEKKLDTVEAPGVVFDNFPFNKGQLDFLMKYTEKNNWEKPVIIYINIDPESAIKRISTRRVCPDCKAVYTGGDICEKCGGKLISRTDDNEETVRTRIGNYMPNIEEVVGAYKKMGELVEIDGEPPINEVYEEVRKIS